MDRKKMIEQRIVDTLLQYFQAHKTGMQMRILSAKFAKSLIAVGGFPEVMQELAKNRRIRIEILKSGAQVVYPVTSLEAEDAKKYF